MSFACEITGELLPTIDGDVVVTPSGHVCGKRLLLAKLSENGGKDPFENSRALTEDDLVTLQHFSQKSKPISIIPPNPKATSMPGLLTALQREYDSLALELFDTRKALEETRQELSQALYQNDAAVRVVARMGMERDAARQALQDYQAGANSKAPVPDPDEDNSNKKRKIEEATSNNVLKEADGDATVPFTNELPGEDLKIMIASWEVLKQTRKASQKAAAAKAPSSEAVASYALSSLQSWHKSSCRGITAMAGAKAGLPFLVTTGKDKQIVVYDWDADKVLHTVSSGSKPALSVDINEAYVVAGLATGKVELFALEGGADVGSFSVSNTPIVDVRIHPDGQHLLTASESGRVTISRFDRTQGITPISVFHPEHEEKYVCGVLHPDGLIYVAGSAFGELLLWDLKSQSLASTLKHDANDDPGITRSEENDAVTNLAFSSNGYHIASSYASGKVVVWDLRKLKALATLNTEGDDILGTVHAISFDPSGKYLAFGGPGSVRISTVKEWKITASFDVSLASCLVWGDNWLAVSSEKKREIGFFGIKTDVEIE
ncbi:predicted protein [Phaeodactylum tricornutum CCAP 1055/1]|jgi:pre-mRNA-processing factor 19|uniref:Pre-mRNA-processing factor 19 n=2 Tax=Phaeodactylum tricornutum TaxID=2850 RepID=B7S3Y6_PHATC|nr:predicted protein [Phaeodactylum tricornutum CCAP 1055/1]EEC42741.1 predicted protein [Phaeodactylum tricornutum CCAP 1055/1]|eukprot:XP_002176277.1 predicted protein [Phaeodactylum tricornutum CCAP 1055/1]